MFLVVGVPCGGTSLAAGILYHLGVDMGDVDFDVSGVKPYPKFECREMLGIVDKLGSDASIYDLHDRFKEYCKRGGGVKNFTLNRLALHPELLDDLPITTIHVRRNVETAFMSDAKYRGWNLERGAAMGRMYLTMLKMLAERPPVAVADFNRILTDPVGETKAIAEKLDIGWRQEAADFVEQNTRGYDDRTFH